MQNIQRIVEYTFKQLTQPLSASDPILKCQPALDVIRVHPKEVQSLAYARIHAFTYNEVPLQWLGLYLEASLWITHNELSKLIDDKGATAEVIDRALTKIIENLDKALIITGNHFRKDLTSFIFEELGSHFQAIPQRAKKRRKIGHNEHTAVKPRDFAPASKASFPPIKEPVKQFDNMSMVEFQQYLDKSHRENKSRGALPCVIKNAISQWPALSTRPWSNPDHFFDVTIGGRRLVPIEIGRSYTDNDWSQKLVPLRQFMEENMFRNNVPAKERCYLAQYEIFEQMKELRDDIMTPDYCFTDAPVKHGQSGIDSDEEEGDEESKTFEKPKIHAWIGPAHTISPAHTDPYSNILAQVVGYKYVRLYPPWEHTRLYPRGLENGISMSNTSEVDVGLGMRLLENWQGWNEKDKNGNEIKVESKEEFELKFPKFHDAMYQEVILGPGDCLFIPTRWWHYVHSLSPSASVSFWWK